MDMCINRCKTALVTGASRGIGAAVARALAAQGCRVAVNYNHSKEEAEALAAEIGGIAVQADVSDPRQVQEMVDKTLEIFCQLDILVCNAGVAWQGLFQQMDDNAWRRLMGVDLDGVFYSCRAVLPHMIHRKFGRIVNISSMWGQVGGACEAAYSAAKAGVIGLTKALAKEMGPSGITVNCVAPGVIVTDMTKPLGAQALEELAEETPVGRLGTPEDVAGCVSFLCSQAGSYLTGQVLAPNGGIVI